MLKYLHRFISYNVLSRGRSNSIVGTGDLFFLWCIKERKPVSTTHFLATHWHQIVTRHTIGSIVFGGYIIAIANSFGFDTSLHKLLPVSGESFLDSTMLLHMDFCEKVGHTYVLLQQHADASGSTEPSAFAPVETTAEPQAATA